MPLFADLDRLKADLDALRPLAPEQEARVLQKFRLEWNYNSNAIEGNSLTLGETRSLLLHGVAASGKSIRDHDDIRNHNKAVAEVELLSTETRPVTEHLIREMHEILLGREPYYVEARTAEGVPTRQLIQPGTYKKNPNQALTATGERIFFASPEETPAEMNALLAWYREQEEAMPAIHPVALAAEFHYRFVRIHPFDDGNGRMSRLLMNLILLRHGYPMTVIQATDRNRYLAVLAEADAGEPEPFLRFIIENVKAGLRLMIRAARGESIDEPSDLDKKLALLKVQLTTPDDTAEYAWNQNTKQEFYHSFLSPWLDDLLKIFEKFDFAFLEKSFSGLILIVDELPFAEHKQISSDSWAKTGIFIINSFENSALNFDNLSVSIDWSFFKKASFQFNLGLILDLDFEKTFFEVSYTIHSVGKEYHKKVPPVEGSVSSELLTLPFRKKYDHAQIHEINLQLANKVYDFIAAKLAEADTLLA